jgi:hypothetical protein
MIEHLPSKFKVLSSNPSTPKQRTNTKKWGGEGCLEEVCTFFLALWPF